MRNLFKLIILLLYIILHMGCITSFSPDSKEVVLQPGQTITFSVETSPIQGEYTWYLGQDVISGKKGNSFQYTFHIEDTGKSVIVESNGLLGKTRNTWEIALNIEDDRFSEAIATILESSDIQPVSQIAGYLEASQEDPDSIDDLIESIRAEYHIPAMAAAVVKGDKIIEIGAKGRRKITCSTEVTIDDVWAIGSNTKFMTATLAAVMVEEGLISWDTTIADIFPDLVPVILPDYHTVTLEQLLSHQAGVIRDYTILPKPLPCLLNPVMIQRRNLVGNALQEEPVAPPGTFADYSNVGVIIAAAMFEEITGKPWEELIEIKVFAPLGITSATFRAPGQKIWNPDQPWGHFELLGLPEYLLDLQSDEQDEESKESLFDNMILPLPILPMMDYGSCIYPLSSITGPAGLVTLSLSDWAKFVSAQLAGARGVGGLISAGSFAFLHTPRGTPGIPGYALGITSYDTLEGGPLIEDWPYGRFLFHDGDTVTFTSILWIIPDSNLAVMTTANLGGVVGREAILKLTAALILRHGSN